MCLGGCVWACFASLAGARGLTKFLVDPARPSFVANANKALRRRLSMAVVEDEFLYAAKMPTTATRDLGRKSLQLNTVHILLAHEQLARDFAAKPEAHACSHVLKPPRQPKPTKTHKQPNHTNPSKPKPQQTNPQQDLAVQTNPNQEKPTQTQTSQTNTNPNQTKPKQSKQRRKTRPNLNQPT